MNKKFIKCYKSFSYFKNVKPYFISSRIVRKYATDSKEHFNNHVTTLKPFSSLHVNIKYSQVIFNCLKPIFNFERYFDSEFIDKIKYNLECRHKKNGIKNGLAPINYDKLKEDLSQYLQLKKEFNVIKSEVIKLKKKLDKDVQLPNDLLEKLNIAKKKFLDKDEELIPILLRIPNFFSNQVPIDGYEDIVLNEIKPKLYNFKLLDCKKISYINKFRISSIVGPHSDFLIGKGSILQIALKKYFKHYIENYFPDKNFVRQLHEVDGLDIVKSVIIEASNDYDFKNFSKNSLIIKNIKDSQKVHLVGNCSLESLICFFGKKEFLLKLLPTKFIQFGSTYNQEMNQFNSVYLVILTKNNFEESNFEFQKIENMLWDFYKSLRLPIRLRKCNICKLAYNEYYKIELDVWFPYLGEWKKMCDFKHYSDYISLRIGNKFTHILSGNLIDLDLLLNALIENNQTDLGKISIPDCIKPFMDAYTI